MIKLRRRPMQSAILALLVSAIAEANVVTRLQDIVPGETLSIDERTAVDQTIAIRDKHGTSDKPVVISFSPDAWLVAAKQTSAVLELEHCSHVVIKGLKLDGAGMVTYGLKMEDVQYVQIEDFHVRHCRRFGIHVSSQPSAPRSQMNQHLVFRRGLIEDICSDSEAVTGMLISSRAGQDGVPMDHTFHDIEIDGVEFRNIRAPADSDGIKIFPGNTPDADRRDFVVNAVIRNCRFYDMGKRACKLRGQNIALENIVAESPSSDASVRGGPLIDFQSVKNLKATNIRLKATNHNMGFSGHRYIENVLVENAVVECVNADGDRGWAIGWIGCRLMKNVTYKNVRVVGPWNQAINFLDEDAVTESIVFDGIVATESDICLPNRTHAVTIRNSTLGRDRLKVHEGVVLENIRFDAPGSSAGE